MRYSTNRNESACSPNRLSDSVAYDSFLSKCEESVMKISLILFSFCFLSIQTEISLAQNYQHVYRAYPFQQNTDIARSDAIGHAGIGMVDSSSVCLLNPAGFAFLRDNQIIYTHTNWLPLLDQYFDLTFDRLSISNYIRSLRGTVSISASYLSLGTFSVDAPSDYAFSIGPTSQFSFTVGYSFLAADNIGIGTNIRFIKIWPTITIQSSSVKSQGNTVSIDFATLWRIHSLQLPFIGELKDKLSIGIILTNLGPKITYRESSESSPLRTLLGAGIDFKAIRSDSHEVSFLFDLNRILLQDYELSSSAGIEYWYGNPRIVAARVGYLSKEPESQKDYLTFGAGFRYGVSGLDFCYHKEADGNPISETLLMTLSLQW
jgi:hypothetical protein